MTGRPWASVNYAVIDLETSGMDPTQHEVLSVGVVDVIDGRVRMDSQFYRELRPSRDPDAGSIVIHGMLPDRLALGLPAQDVGSELISRLADRVLVAHVSWLERSFLDSWLRPHGWTAPVHVLDTDVLTRLYLQKSRGEIIEHHVGLGSAAALFGLPEHSRHHALGDALTTAQLFLAVVTELGPSTTLEQLFASDVAFTRLARRQRLRRMFRR